MSVDLHEHLRALAGEPTTRLDELNDVAWASTAPQTLELCRLRIADMLGDARGLARRTPAAAGVDEAKIAALPDWRNSALFTAAERARLGFTEQFVVSVSSLSDSDVDPLRADADDLDIYLFVNAIYVLDLTTRVDLMTRAIFDDVPTNGARL
jgi:alkylhydroperoxidase family enzyme